MAYEVELKYRLVDHVQIERLLRERGALSQPPITQVDIYLRHPARDFAVTYEALRIRKIGDQNRITYKGPRLSGPTKTREEIEIAIAPGESAFQELLRLWRGLGFEQVATIRKVRTSFHVNHLGRDVEVALDRAADLGDFAEVEALASTESELPAAQSAVLALADELGLTEVEPRSYLRMTMQALHQPPAGGVTAL